VAVPCLRRNAFVRNGDAPAGDQLSPGWGVRILRLGRVKPSTRSLRLTSKG
jgi:hypothetical protein